ncbi:hypothetical protein FVE85_2555 [Porphyridium purpureum]|uniref:Uncharacterized protein n=1 Tax=Porphyridium purpureum TaxID=35688 RepID=A0A5J4YKX5_PORPP|nr:hypothetical protein FVE85_2555 [Porphyridium purpureum]|eukprot:POR1678..scf291_13
MAFTWHPNAKLKPGSVTHKEDLGTSHQILKFATIARAFLHELPERGGAASASTADEHAAEGPGALACAEPSAAFADSDVRTQTPFAFPVRVLSVATDVLHGWLRGLGSVIMTGVQLAESNNKAWRNHVDTEMEGYAAQTVPAGCEEIHLGGSRRPRKIFNSSRSQPIRCLRGAISSKVGMAGRFEILEPPGATEDGEYHGLEPLLVYLLQNAGDKNTTTFFVYVTRLDESRNDHVEHMCMQGIERYLGNDVWQRCLLLFTFAAALPPRGISYAEYVRGRRDYMSLLLRSVAGSSVPYRSLQSQNSPEESLSSISSFSGLHGTALDSSTFHWMPCSRVCLVDVSVGEASRLPDGTEWRTQLRAHLEVLLVELARGPHWQVPDRSPSPEDIAQDRKHLIIVCAELVFMVTMIIVSVPMRKHLERRRIEKEDSAQIDHFYAPGHRPEKDDKADEEQSEGDVVPYVKPSRAELRAEALRCIEEFKQQQNGRIGGRAAGDEEGAPFRIDEEDQADGGYLSGEKRPLRRDPQDLYRRFQLQQLPSADQDDS